MLDHLAPADPIYGQLWLNNGVLFYFDGTTWKPVRALAVDGSKLNVSAFEDFVILSPLTQDGNMVVPDNYDLALLEYQRAVEERASRTIMLIAILNCTAAMVLLGFVLLNGR